MRDTTMNEKETLQLLGERLRSLRLHRNETQQIMGERLGVSRQAYARMEEGDPKTPIGCWIAASTVLRKLADWDYVFKEENLFLRAEIEEKLHKRKRARSK